MKNKNLMMGLGFMAFSMSIQAQTTIAQLGFEPGDTKYATDGALTPGGTYGDWVNVKDGDAWNEQYQKNVKSGEYAFQAVNASGTGNTWDRGFKIGNLNIKENTPYRVSFWIKAPESFFNDDNEEKNTSLNAWLSQGIENYDKSFCSPSGGNYGVEMTKGFTGEWQYISFLSYYANADVLNNVIANQSWVGSSVYPESMGGDGVKTYAEYFNNKLPEKYFVVINMYCPVEYTLDDIKVEEGVTFNQAQFANDVIKLDFGYPTNINSLAEANNGSFSLDPSCVTVKVNGEAAPVEFLEGKSDGYLYIFLKTPTEETDQVEVSFTPAADCPVIYNSDRRPSSDTESEMKVLAFSGEKAYFNSEVSEVLPASWSPAEMVSSNPESGSFEIAAEDLKNVAVTYDKEVDLTSTSATLVCNGKETDLSSGLTLSDDKLTINVAMPTLADGEYTLILSGVENAMGVSCTTDQEITFAVGADTDQSESKVVYSTNETFAATANGTFPVGWLSNDNGTIHQYGLTESGEVWNYNWGGNVGGGGCRAMTGYSGDLNGAAIYWRCMNGSNSEGTLTFGEQVKDYILADGTVDPEMDPNIALKLDAAKYQISIRMCAWKNLNGNTDAVSKDNAPKYNFTLEDLSGNVYAEFNDVSAMPNVVGAQNIAVNNVTLSQTDFTVSESGYYMLKFKTTQANGEYLLGGVELITMPSKAAYYKQLLNAAIASAKDSLTNAAEATYDGETKTALQNAINAAETGHFTSPSAINAQIAALNTAAVAMGTRKTNIDAFNNSIADAQIALLSLEEEENQKYMNDETVATVKTAVEKYGSVDPSTLSDATLAEVTPLLVSASKKIANVKNNVDILTFDAVKAGTTASALGADCLNVFDIADDNREVINKVNANAKGALYSKIAAKEDLSQYMTKVYDLSTSVEEIPAGEEANYDEEGHPVLFSGIDFTGYIQNTHLYRVYGDDGVPGWAIAAGSDSTSLNIGYSATPDSINTVVDAQIQIYGNADYDFSQTIENLPAGIYTLAIQTRTPLVGPKDVEVDGVTQQITYYYNAQDANGVWDKYIFAKGDGDEAEGVAAYKGASGLTSTYVQNVTVKDGKLLIGAHEHYGSGKAVKHEDNTPQDFWTGTSYVDYVNIYFTAPLDDFDYAAAAVAVNSVAAGANTVSDIYSVDGVRMNKMQKGINIVKMSDGTVKKVFVK